MLSGKFEKKDIKAKTSHIVDKMPCALYNQFINCGRGGVPDEES